MTSPSASYGLGTSLTPGRAVGCRRYTAEHVEKDGSRYGGIKRNGDAKSGRRNGSGRGPEGAPASTGAAGVEGAESESDAGVSEGAASAGGAGESDEEEGDSEEAAAALDLRPRLCRVTTAEGSTEMRSPGWSLVFGSRACQRIRQLWWAATRRAVRERDAPPAR